LFENAIAKSIGGFLSPFDALMDEIFVELSVSAHVISFLFPGCNSRKTHNHAIPINQNHYIWIPILAQETDQQTAAALDMGAFILPA